MSFLSISQKWSAIPGMGRGRRSMIALLLCVLFVPTLGSAADEGEYRLKAAFIFNFIKYTEWPAASPLAGNEIVVGVLGVDPFKGFLGLIEGRTVKGRRVTIQKGNRLQDLKGCNVLVVSKSEAPRMREVIGSLKGAPVLTVSDLDGFAESGGIVGFVVEQDSVHFNINIAAAKRSGLTISSEILKLAKVIKG